MATSRSFSSHAESSIFDLDDMDNDSTPDASTVDADSQMEAIEASIESSLKVLNDNQTSKKLTMQLIRQSVSMVVQQSARRLLPKPDAPETQQAEEDDDRENEIDALLQKKVLRLDWMSIGKIENLEAFTHIQELYLQHNLLQQIENLDDHLELTFLALGGNRIQRVTNIKHLTNLKFLDLSNNAIDDFDVCEFPPSLVILRLAGNPFTRHMPAYMHLFFERLPNLKQIDQYRRASSHLTPVGSPLSHSPLSFSPRSKISELAMEIEMSQKDHTVRGASLPTTDPVDLVSSDGPFDSGDYAKQKQARMATWKQQLHDLESRKLELEGDIPMITRSTSGATLRSRRTKLIATAREVTETAIADSIAHFQQMELQHQAWQEQQHQAA